MHFEHLFFDGTTFGFDSNTEKYAVALNNFSTIDYGCDESRSWRMLCSLVVVYTIQCFRLRVLFSTELRFRAYDFMLHVKGIDEEWMRDRGRKRDR